MNLPELLNVRRFSGLAHEGPTLVFAHGYGCDQSMWADVVEGLPAFDRVLFDWAGVGGSPMSAYDSTRHASLAGYAEDLLRLLEALKLQRVVLIAHSVAASVAALAALREPGRFAQLCMIAPSPCFANDPPEYRGGFEQGDLLTLIQGLAEDHASWSHAVAPLVVGNAAAVSATARLERSFCAMDPTIALIWARATFLADVRDAMRQVETPTVVLQCRDDALAPVQVGQWMADHMPLARLHLLQATGHCPHITSPAEVLGVLRDSLDWRR